LLKLSAHPNSYFLAKHTQLPNVRVTFCAALK
jgi:hypothetical protein